MANKLPISTLATITPILKKLPTAKLRAVIKILERTLITIDRMAKQQRR